MIKKKYDLRSLHSILCGGAPLSREVTEGFLEKYPNVTILQGYGLTESTTIGASTDSLEESSRYCTIGLRSPCMEAKIVDPEGGEALPMNYESNEEAMASTLDSDGWLRTGDLCYVDEDGFVFVVDRLKELIKYKGYQVPPAELGALLRTHPDITDAAVIPFTDEKVGHGICGERAVLDFIAKQVAPYKKIRRVAFTASIPKNPSGKILRKDLIKLCVSKL